MRFSHLLLLLLVILVWGCNFVVIEIGLHDIPPLMLCMFRFLLTGIPAIFFFKRPAIPIKILILYGCTMFALQFTFLFSGIYAGVTAGLASLIVQMQVFFTITLAALFLRERPSAWQIMGMLISCSGIILVGVKLEGSVTLLGFSLIVAAAATWGAGNLISKKIPPVNMFSLVVWGNFIAFFPLLLATVLFEGKTQMLFSLHHLSWASIIAVLYIVYFSTLFGYGTWSWLLRCYPMTTIAPYALLIPIIGFLSSALIMHEPIQSWKLFAGFLVVLGLCVNFVGSRWTAGRLSSRLPSSRISNRNRVEIEEVEYDAT